jgi:tetratricopeptide (TPR) repeat protein
LDAPRKTDHVGQILLHYQVIERLGTGTLGVVCRAIDLKQKRSAALRFLPASITATPEAKQRFVREMRACAALDHANIGTLRALEETEDGRLFLVMDFYEGPTLARRMETHPVGVDEAVALALQLLGGLSEAHERNIVHGDIKPGNLVFNSLGMLKILDFGLAKFRGDPALAPSGPNAETVAYMSPEQATGAPADRRSDLWSASVVIYEMFSRRPLFAGSDPQTVMAAIISAEAISVQGIPRGLDKVLKKALEIDPDLRYRTAGEMVADLEAEKRKRQRSTSGQEDAPPPVEEDAAEPAYETPRAGRGRENAAAGSGRWMVAVLVLTLLAGGAVAVWLRMRQPESPPGVALALGRVRLLQGRYPEAVAEFEQVLASDPRNDGAYRGLAQTYAAMGLTEKAVESWRRDISLQPNSVDPYVQLGKFELNRRDYAAAVANFRAALNLAPADASILSDLGAALSHQGARDESRKVLEDSIRLEPSFSGWTNLGDLDLKQRRFPAAATDYEKALELNDADYHVWTSLAVAYAHTPGQKDKTKDALQHAAELCRGVLKANPNDPAVQSDLALIFALGTDGRQESLASIKRALSLAPDDIHVQFNAAEIYTVQGNRKAARSLVEKLVTGGYPIEDIDASPILTDFAKNSHA